MEHAGKLGWPGVRVLQCIDDCERERGLDMARRLGRLWCGRCCCARSLSGWRRQESAADVCWLHPLSPCGGGEVTNMWGGQVGAVPG